MRPAICCLGGALLSGLLFVFALPLGEQSYLAWFALTPLLLAVRGRGLLWGFLGGLLTVFFAAWMAEKGFFYRYREPMGSPYWVYTGFGLYGFSLSLACGAWADSGTQRRPAWWFAALATLLEACLLLELPAHLALTQYRQAVMVQISALGGIWLVSFLVWWANFQLAMLKPRALAIGIVALVAASFATRNLWFQAGGPSCRFAAIQVADPDEDSLARLQAKASETGAALVVWPESSGIPLVSSGDASELQKLSVASGAFVTSFPDGFKPLPHNASVLFWKGAESVRYAKRKLFGGEAKSNTPGNIAVAVPYSRGRVGLNICYDSCFPEVIRDTARLSGVNVVALPSHDPLGSNHFIAAIHASFTPFRAAEERLAFVKADGIAFSMLVGPEGKIVAEAPPGDRVLSGDLTLGRGTTPYKLFGDWFLFLCGSLVLLGLWRSGRGIPDGNSDHSAQQVGE